MKESLLLEGENYITKSDNEEIVLTNMRLRRSTGSSSDKYLMSILLEKISHIEVRYTSHPVLILLALLMVVGGLVLQPQLKLLALIMGGAAVLSILYLITRKHQVQITTEGGGKLSFATNGMKEDAIIQFINKVENAIRLRRNL
jgi:hypothetical protein